MQLLTLDLAQVIENILDDDQDMEDMNLGQRAENEEKLLNVCPFPGCNDMCQLLHMSLAAAPSKLTAHPWGSCSWASLLQTTAVQSLQAHMAGSG